MAARRGRLPAADATGIYLTGYTTSADFPLANAYQDKLAGGYDAFVTKFNPAGSGLLWSSFLGGDSSEFAYALALNAAGNVFVAGATYSRNFPTVRAVQPANNSKELFYYDAFVTRFSANGRQLDYSTYLGGGNDDQGYNLAVDAAGNAYVTGYTQSPDFPIVAGLTVNPPNTLLDWQAFVARLNAAGTAWDYSITLGGDQIDIGQGIAVDTAGNTYLTGWTSSENFPTTPGAIRRTGPRDAFVAKIAVSADLALTLSDLPDPVQANGTLSYTATVTNNGPDAANNVSVTDTLPTGVSFVSAKSTQGSCSGTSTVTCNLGTLANKARATVSLVVKLNAGTTALSNRVTVTSATLDGDSSNNSATQETRTGTLPSLFGRVTQADGNGFGGVSLNLGGSQRPAVTTASDGSYQFTALAAGANYTVTPSLSGFAFNPPSRTFNNLTADQRADFTVTQCTFTLASAEQTVQAVGGTGTLTLTAADPQCPWTARSNASWLKLNNADANGVVRGNGNAQIRFSVEPTVVARTAIITAGGRVFPIFQQFYACNEVSYPSNVVLTGVQLGPMVAALSYINNSLTVRLSGGRGVFSQPAFGSPALVVAEDFNGDGTIDLAIGRGRVGGILFNRALCPPPSAAIATSAASFALFNLAPEAISALFGANLATSTQVANSVPLPTQLAGVSVRLRDQSGAERNAPLFFVSPNQINFQVPPDLANGVALLTVLDGDNAVASGTLSIAPVTPGLFTANASGAGLAAAVVLRVRANGQQVFEPVALLDAQNRLVAVPIDLSDEREQVFLLLYGTGIRGRSVAANVKARIGSVEATALFAGAAPGLIGLDQINLLLPRSLAGSGEVNLVLTVDGRAANPNTIYLTIANMGAFKSTDGGETWRTLDASLASRTVRVIVNLPDAPQKLYAGAAVEFDAFVAKLNANGSALVYSTYLGGAGNEGASALAVDAANNVYVTGSTFSTDFPVANAYRQSPAGNEDVYVAKLNPAGAALLWSTYLGGSEIERPYGLALNAAGNVFVVGQTASNNFPLSKALQAMNRSVPPQTSDAFVTRFSTDGKQLDFSTYLGGSASDYVIDVVVDAVSNVYVTGSTSSTDFPVVNAVQPKRGGRLESGSNAFVAKLQADGAALSYSTYLGGDNTDSGQAIAVDARGSVYVGGYTSSRSFPLTPNALRSQLAGPSEGFVIKLAIQAELALTMADLPDPVRNPGQLTYTLQVVNNGPDAALDVQLTDTLPATAQLARITTTQGACTGTGSLTCALGALNAKAKATVTIEVQPTNLEPLTNRASVTSSTADANPANNAATETTRVTQQASVFGRVATANGDGLPDIAVARGRNRVEVLLGRGRGEFGPATSSTVGENPQYPIIHDFDNDGRPDVVVMNRESASLSLLFGNGNGTFQVLNSITTGARPNTYAVNDFNNDGKADLLVKGRSAGLALWLNEGGRNFREAQTGIAANLDDPWFVAGDFDGDGNADVVVLSLSTSATCSTALRQPFLLLGDGRSGFGAPRPLDIDDQAVRLFAADLNLDGLTDLLFTSDLCSRDPSFKVMLASGGNFSAPVKIDNGSGELVLPTIADANGDGRSDVVVKATGPPRLILNKGNGTFGEPMTLRQSRDEGATAIGDFNQDGAPDLAFLGPELVVTLNRGGCFATGGQPSPLVTVSAANYAPFVGAREAIVAAFGTGLAQTTQAATTLPLPTTLGNASIRLKDSAGVERAAPLSFVSPTQINFLIPPDAAPGGATVTARNGSSDVAAGTVQITPVAPGLFTANASGLGLAAGVVVRIKADGTQSFEPVVRLDSANRLVPVPIDVSNENEVVYLLLFGAGLRQRSAPQNVVAQAGGSDLLVQYIGAQGSLVGLDQINLQMPRSLQGRGEVELTLLVDGRVANPVKVHIK